ncbi:hypothetical protein [Streptomyces varsoviensis]|uniref:Uncharacterized protein n=1 Tax=Streptomyces varsoviensis TaxID=67373 RepID=A0ABR5IXH0_9ACTN|nr:hypothetical protein [Streptomyces varsoviensis]KOG85845.1 hypothetical protein ADK38_34410 [Streptomyces varsoviensis]
MPPETTTPYAWNLDTAKKAITDVGAYRFQYKEIKDTLLGIHAHSDVKRIIHCKNANGSDFDHHPSFGFQGQLSALNNLLSQVIDLDSSNVESIQTVIKTAVDAVPPVTARYQTAAEALAATVEKVKKGTLDQQTRDQLTSQFHALHYLLMPPEEWTQAKQDFAGRIGKNQEFADRIAKLNQDFKSEGERVAREHELLAQKPEAACGRNELLSYASEVRMAIKQVLQQQSLSTSNIVGHATDGANALAKLIGSLNSFANDYKTAAEELDKASLAEVGSLVQRIDFDSSRDIWNEYAETVKKLPSQ